MLKDKIPELLNYIKGTSDTLQFNRTIFEILEGDLLTKSDAALKSQVISDRAYTQAKDRIPPINIIKRLTEKLTQLYTGKVVRTANKSSYQKVVDFYETQFDLNEKFNQANLFYNSNKLGMLEPYIDRDEEPMLRVLPPHRGLVYSDDPTDETRPTTFIELMGEYTKEDGVGRSVEFFFAYTDTEFIAFDADGDLLPRFMVDNDGINPYEFLPLVYINKSDYLLIPIPDKDLLSMQILIVLLLTDLAFGIKYQAHAILWTKNADIENLDLNPNSYINLQTTDDGKEPSIGTIKPDIDIESTIAFVNELLNLWLESKNLKPTASASTSNSDYLSSGIALMIREIDTTMDVKRQMRKFVKGEAAFWKMMIKVHNYWVETGVVKGLPLLPDDFKVTVEHALPEPIIDEEKEVNLVLKQLNVTMTLKQALQRLYPQKSEKEIELLATELSKIVEIAAADEDKDNDEDDEDDTDPDT